MKPKTSLLSLWLTIAAAFLVLLPATLIYAQHEPGSTLPESLAPGKAPAAAPGQTEPAQAAPAKAAAAAESAATPPDRAVAYYHLALATIYEDEALESGRPEYITRAIEEYKTALNADPSSPQLNDGLADLYFRTGHAHDAEVTARALLKSSPNDIDAHKLLGKIYLRQLERCRQRRLLLLALRQCS